MATISLAMWFQEPDLAGTNRLIMIFIGLVAAAMVVQAISVVILTVRSHKAIAAVMEDVTLIKSKIIPLIDVSTDTIESAQTLLRTTTPKIHAITDTLVDTSRIVRSTAQQFEKTAADANLRTHAQVVRVDGMVTAALVTTAEVVESINHGIRVPAQKVAVIATQAKLIAEGLFAKVRAMAGNLPFGNRPDRNRPGERF